MPQPCNEKYSFTFLLYLLIFYNLVDRGDKSRKVHKLKKKKRKEREGKQGINMVKGLWGRSRDDEKEKEGAGEVNQALCLASPEALRASCLH